MGTSKGNLEYQHLEKNFFALCQEREIYRLPQLLYIYLLGRYHECGMPEFDWPDAEIRKHLGVSTQTLKKAKNHLQERGVILYESGAGKKCTHYIMLTQVPAEDLEDAI